MRYNNCLYDFFGGTNYINYFCDEKTKIETRGLFLNADSGFDTKGFRNQCEQNEIFDNIDMNKRKGDRKDNTNCIFDELLYRARFAMERTNAWLDAFKAILVRFETKSMHWESLNMIAFTIILLRKL